MIQRLFRRAYWGTGWNLRRLEVIVRALPKPESEATFAAPLGSAYGGILGAELRQWLNAQDINGDTIGSIRRQCFVPWDSSWNGLVRDETAAREK